MRLNGSVTATRHFDDLPDDVLFSYVEQTYPPFYRLEDFIGSISAVS